jgi:hypothetical protein
MINLNTSPLKRLGIARGLYNQNTYLTPQTHHKRFQITSKNKENKTHTKTPHTHTTKATYYTHLNKLNKNQKPPLQPFNKTPPKTPPKYIYSKHTPTQNNNNKQNKLFNITRKNITPYETQQCKNKIHTNNNAPKIIQDKAVTTTTNHNGPRPTGLGHKIHINTSPYTINKVKHSRTIRKNDQKINSPSHKTQKHNKNTSYGHTYHTSKKHTKNETKTIHRHKTLTTTIKPKRPQIIKHDQKGNRINPPHVSKKMHNLSQ